MWFRKTAAPATRPRHVFCWRKPPYACWRRVLRKSGGLRMAAKRKPKPEPEPESIAVHNRLEIVRDSADAADLFAQILQEVRNQKRINEARGHSHDESNSQEHH